MRILWVKVGGLWPPNTGGRLRSFHILSELARRHPVTLVTTHHPDEDPAALRTQLPQCEAVVSIPYAAPKWNSPRFPAMLLRSWFSSLPVDLWKCRVAALRHEVSQHLASGDFDLCIADFLVAVPNVPLQKVTPVVFFAHNVEHMIWKRLGANEKRPWFKFLLEIEWRKMRRYEARACREANLTIAVSEQDRELLAANSPGARVYAMPTGVDVGYFTADGTPEEPLQLVFTGSMDWHPNEDAMLYFMHKILPAVRRELPGVRLTVVGRNPGKRLLQAAKAADVAVTGTVDDVRPYMSAAPVYVVPLRIGGGTRLKIFEALSMCKAVVSTSVGAEGLPLIPGEHYVQADDAAAFAAAIVALLRDPGRRTALGLAGRSLTQMRYSWPQVTREFAAFCEAALG